MLEILKSINEYDIRLWTYAQSVLTERILLIGPIITSASITTSSTTSTTTTKGDKKTNIESNIESNIATDSKSSSKSNSESNSELKSQFALLDTTHALKESNSNENSNEPTSIFNKFVCRSKNTPGWKTLDPKLIKDVGIFRPPGHKGPLP